MVTVRNTDDPTLSTPHPLAETLGRLPEAYGTGEPAVRLGSPGTGGIWIPSQGLLTRQSGLINDAMAEIATAYNAPTRDVQGSFFFGAYAWTLLTASLGPYLLASRVPDISPGNVWIALAGGRANRAVLRSGRFACLPNDPAATHPHATALANPEALITHLRTGIETHLGALIGVMRVRRVPLGPRALWATVSDYIVELAIGHLGPDANAERLASIATPLLHAPKSPLNGRTSFFEVTGDRRTAFFTDRNGCCLNHKIPGSDKCASCPLRPKPERIALMRDYLNTLS